MTRKIKNLNKSMSAGVIDPSLSKNVASSNDIATYSVVSTSNISTPKMVLGSCAVFHNDGGF